MKRALAAAAAILMLALAGCASAGGTPTAAPVPTIDPRPLTELPLLPDPRNADGPRTAVIADQAITPVVADPQQHLPAQVVSHDQGGDVPVTVTDTSRVITLDIAGSIAATVWGLGMGSHLVGRDISTTFPGASSLPLVTVDGHSINAEAVLALRPTLILTDGTIGPRDVVEQLRQAGVTVVFLQNAASFQGAEQLARDTAAALGVPDAGTKLANQIASQIAAERAFIDAVAPRDAAARPRIMFLYLRGDAGINYLFGQGSGADQLIDALDGVDVTAELGWVGEKPVTDEAIVAADPDVVLVMTDGLASVGGVDGLLAAKPALGLTNAGQHRRFVDMADGVVLGFGPRSAEVLDALARAIYAQG